MLHRNPVVWLKVLLQNFSSSTRDFLGLASKELLPGMTTWNMGKADYGSALKHCQHLPLCWAGGCAIFIFWDKCLMASGEKSKAWKLRIFNQIQEFCFQADSVGSLGTQVPCAGGWNSNPANFPWEKGKKALGDTEALMGTIFGRFDCLV